LGEFAGVSKRLRRNGSNRWSGIRVKEAQTSISLSTAESMASMIAPRTPGCEPRRFHMKRAASLLSLVLIVGVSEAPAQSDGGTQGAAAPAASEKPAGQARDGASVQALRRIVDDCNRKSIEAFKKGDMLAVARLYTDDATIYFPRGKHVRGRRAIDQLWMSIKGPKDWKLETLEVGGTKEAIYEVGKSSLTTEENGKESTYVCDYVVIWKRQKDGSYKTQTDIYN
jgi:ketosteroid isomerase-like protein